MSDSESYDLFGRKKQDDIGEIDVNDTIILGHERADLISLLSEWHGVNGAVCDLHPISFTKTREQEIIARGCGYRSAFKLREIDILRIIDNKPKL